MGREKDWRLWLHTSAQRIYIKWEAGVTERNRHFKTQIATRGLRIMTTGRNLEERRLLVSLTGSHKQNRCSIKR